MIWSVKQNHFSIDFASDCFDGGVEKRVQFQLRIYTWDGCRSGIGCVCLNTARGRDVGGEPPA